MGVRIKNDICIRVRVTGIRVRITSRGRIAEVVLGCSRHYIDPFLPRTTKTQISSNAILVSDLTGALTTHTPLKPVYLTYGAPPKP